MWCAGIGVAESRITGTRAQKDHYGAYLGTRVGIATVALLDTLAIDAVRRVRLVAGCGVLWGLLLIMVKSRALGRLVRGSVPIARRDVEAAVGFLADTTRVGRVVETYITASVH